MDTEKEGSEYNKGLKEKLHQERGPTLHLSPCLLWKIFTHMLSFLMQK